MPKKSQRVAARQAQLSGRAKRERPHGPAGVPATRATQQAIGPGGDGSASGERQRYTTPPVQESQGFAPSSAARQRGRSPQLPPIETYFAPELRRIALGAAVVIAILVVLMFVLR